MKTLLNLLMMFLLISVISCGKKTTTETSGNNTTDTKGVNEKVETVEFKCAGMHCSGCEETITSEVKKIDGVKDIKADAKGKIVTVSFDANKTNNDNISKAINKAGYDTELSKPENKNDYDTVSKKDGKKN